MENQSISTELTQHFPDIDRARAYDIQRLRLEHREQTEARVGWKIGWSNQPNPRVCDRSSVWTHYGVQRIGTLVVRCR